MKAHLTPTPDEIAARRLTPESIERAAALFREFGFLAIDGVHNVDYLGTVHDAYLEAYGMADDPSYDGAFNKVGHKRYMITVEMSGVFNDARLYANPMVLPIIRALLDEDHVLNGFGSVISFPGSEQQHTHADHPPLYGTDEALNGNLPPFAITVVTPLVDLDEAVGSTAVYEGSHKYSTLNQERSEACGVTVPLTQRGSVYLMDYRLIHYGMANLSDRPRPILYSIYSRPWFVDSVNYRRIVPVQMPVMEFFEVAEEHHYLFQKVGGLNKFHLV